MMQDVREGVRVVEIVENFETAKIRMKTSLMDPERKVR